MNTYIFLPVHTHGLLNFLYIFIVAACRIVNVRVLESFDKHSSHRQSRPSERECVWAEEPLRFQIPWLQVLGSARSSVLLAIRDLFQLLV